MKVKFIGFFLCTLCVLRTVNSQSIPYPYPIQSISLDIEGSTVKMAYMDVKPISANGKAVILFHGKNFNGIYWKNVISALTANGYRVIVPDQVGWGKSTKPNVKYTFSMLANNNRQLLDTLSIAKVLVLGHSMGGMLATKFALLYPERTEKLVLEDPLGLEDYKKFIPYKTMEQEYKKELNGTYTSYEKYQKTYYPVWRPEYELYVRVQAEQLKQKDFSAVAWVNALTYQMIYEQPVLYEFINIKVPTLIIVGQLDRTVLGKEMLGKEQQQLHGNFPLLAQKAKTKIKDCKVIILPGAGHIPHIQVPFLFNKSLISFLKD
ncbi:MAG: alpha/beta hydrolase [Chitinophagaceae bacterium]|nr:alpha/beta hydrolase [Chitinophagaceae bacterium]HEV8081836.1 alpha/beta hydrolase [Chitinophagaceae bacterium]